jgi:hypothetical protein
MSGSQNWAVRIKSTCHPGVHPVHASGTDLDPKPVDALIELAQPLRERLNLQGRPVSMSRHSLEPSSRPQCFRGYGWVV